MGPSVQVTGGKGSYNRKCQPCPACISVFCSTHKQAECSFLSEASELAPSRDKTLRAVEQNKTTKPLQSNFSAGFRETDMNVRLGGGVSPRAFGMRPQTLM